METTRGPRVLARRRSPGSRKTLRDPKPTGHGEETEEERHPNRWCHTVVERCDTECVWYLKTHHQEFNHAGPSHPSIMRCWEYRQNSGTSPVDLQCRLDLRTLWGGTFGGRGVLETCAGFQDLTKRHNAARPQKRHEAHVNLRSGQRVA